LTSLHFILPIQTIQVISKDRSTGLYLEPGALGNPDHQ